MKKAWLLLQGEDSLGHGIFQGGSCLSVSVYNQVRPWILDLSSPELWESDQMFLFGLSGRYVIQLCLVSQACLPYSRCLESYPNASFYSAKAPLYVWAHMLSFNQVSKLKLTLSDLACLNPNI